MLLAITHQDSGHRKGGGCELKGKAEGQMRQASRGGAHPGSQELTAALLQCRSRYAPCQALPVPSPGHGTG